MIKKKQRAIFVICIAMLGILLLVFSQTYEENKALKSRLGAEYQNVVMDAINFLTYEVSTDQLHNSFEGTRGGRNLHLFYA